MNMKDKVLRDILVIYNHKSNVESEHGIVYDLGEKFDSSHASNFQK